MVGKAEGMAGSDMGVAIIAIVPIGSMVSEQVEVSFRVYDI